MSHSGGNRWIPAGLLLSWLGLLLQAAAAGELCPFDGVLALLDPLLGSTATDAKLDQVLRPLAEVGHDETDPREQLALVPLDLGPHPTRPMPRCAPVLQSEQELDAVRRRLQRGSPLGDASRVKTTARRLGLESTLRPRGRAREFVQLRKHKTMSPDPFSPP